MKKQDVPQDNSPTYGGHKKVIYATNEAGQYETVGSSGWETEHIATSMAVDALNELALAAYWRVQQGLSSPLEYHMYARRFDIAGLCQATGLFQWQLKRHLKPAVFARLSTKQLQRYQQVMQLSTAELQSIPQQAPTL